jgi:hydrogenase maturation protease
VSAEGPYGDIFIFGKDDIIKSGFSTHNISPKVFIEFLEKETDADIMMIGVTPASTAFGENLSDEVKEAASVLKDFFIKLLPKEGESNGYEVSGR